jgi:hypothetical protein
MVVSYSTGTLDYYPQKVIQFRNSIYVVPANFSNTGGSAQYLFSDRPFVCPQCPGAPPTFGPYQPFSVTDADNLGVTITAPTAFSPTQNPTITLSLLSWGGAQFSIQAQCIAGMLYGVLNDNDVIVFSLRNVRQKPRPPQ